MTYTAQVQFKFDATWTPTYPTSSWTDDTLLPEEHCVITAPAGDLTATQYFKLFEKFLLCVGMCPQSIHSGAMSLVFNDMRSEEDMRKIAEEFDLKLSEDYSKEFRKMQDEIYDLKAKLSRLEQPDNPNYTESEIEAMTAQNQITADTLKSAEVVCKECGEKYGHYSVGCSSTWTGTCNVCGQEKSITEVRDWNYLKEGIDELDK